MANGINSIEGTKGKLNMFFGKYLSKQMETPYIDGSEFLTCLGCLTCTRKRKRALLKRSSLPATYAGKQWDECYAIRDEMTSAILSTTEGITIDASKSLGEHGVRCSSLSFLCVTRPYMQDLVSSGVADTLDQVAIGMGAAIEEFVNTNAQLRLLDVYTLFAVSSSTCVLVRI